ncbi:hypothetical protein [Planctobacterium marinum]|uniref:Uncharacterized protein n=1 Tax=Planctobacterium marinum TaxID=1631968 RepID=A0AA48HN89_9ALTE|nr:hypothetical protein MACH26_11430 [Planctobacterium marinum]
MRNLLILLLLFSTGTIATAEHFPGKFEEKRVPQNTLLQYKKSNIDGSHESQIALYYHDALNIEAFKWTPGNARGTSVNATISAKTLNVIEFSAASVMADGSIIPRAQLRETSPTRFSVQLGEQNTETTLNATLWHSYDFDFASLGFAYRHLSDPRADFNFSILDLDMNKSPPPFIKFGDVVMRFENNEVKLGKNAAHYTINGYGLDNRGGNIWFDSQSKHLLLFEIEKPDERGFTSNRLELVKTATMSAKQWQEFKVSRLTK